MQAVHPRDYYHEQDKQALDALKAIPGFTVALKSFMKVFNEQMMHGLNMANKVRLGSEQLPEIYRYLPPICECLGIEEPEFYLEMNPQPNAYTSGDTQVFITVTSGLLEYLEEDEIKAVIAHECGHVACRHVLYHTMASLLLSGGADFLGLGALTIPLQLALFHWQRCSEFSCDRAAAIYMQGSESVVETMIRLAGGNKAITSKIDTELYLKQAADYEKLVGTSYWNKTLQYIGLMNSTHPFLSVRASEIKKWCESDRFKSIMAYANGTSAVCPKCKAAVEDGWKFCKRCGNQI
ncbi:MAG: M48 family metallopeptidase [Clostridia bacterium]|nr:M48 family metallopeptidase [Clostridia bacterium]